MTKRISGPIFIVGCGRSGTTLLRLMLNRHPQIAIPGETWYFDHLERMREQIAAEPESSWRSIVADAIERAATFPELGVTREQLDEELARISRTRWGDVLAVANLAFARAEGKPRWGDKTPGYVRFLPLIRREFPEAFVIHLIRDGRDVAASFLEQPFGPKSAIDAARYWKRDVELGMQEGAAFPAEQYLEVRYEKLSSEPEGVLRSVCERIGVEFDPAVLDQGHAASKYILPEHFWHEKSAQPVTTARIGRWRDRLTDLDAQLFELEAGTLLKHLGYGIETRKTLRALWLWRDRFLLGIKVRTHRVLGQLGIVK